MHQVSIDVQNTFKKHKSDTKNDLKLMYMYVDWIQIIIIIIQEVVETIREILFFLIQ